MKMKLRTVSLLDSHDREFLLASEYRTPQYINTSTNARLRLAVQHMFDEEYDDEFEMHKEFRKSVPRGRYILSVTIGLKKGIHATQSFDTKILDSVESCFIENKKKEKK